MDWKSIGRAKWSRLSLVMDGRSWGARARSRGLEETRDSETGLIGSVTDRVGGKGGTERLRREVRPSPSRPKSDSLLNFMIPSSCELGQLDVLHGTQPSSGKKNKSGNFLVVVQLIHRLTQADISCTTTPRLFFFPLLVNNLLSSSSDRRRRPERAERGGLQDDAALRRPTPYAVRHHGKNLRQAEHCARRHQGQFIPLPNFFPTSIIYVLGDQAMVV